MTPGPLPCFGVARYPPVLPPANGNWTISPIDLLLLCFRRSLSIEQHAIPAIHHVEMDIKLIDHAHRYVIDHVVEILRVVVERGHGRKNDDAHAREFQHVLEVNLAERRLAHDQHELSSLFENYVGGAMNKIVAEAVRNRGERAHAARRDYHSEGYKRATRDRSTLRADTVTLCRQALYVFQ